MRLTSLLLLSTPALWVGASVWLQGAQVKSEARWPPYSYSATVVVRPDEFSDRALEDRYRRMLASKGAQYRVLRVTVYEDEAAASQNCKCSTDVTYPFWRMLYKDYESALPASAELISVDGRAHMRVRDRRGHVRLRSLSGSAPHKLTVLGRELELVWLETAVGAGLIGGVENEVTVSCYFTTPAEIDRALARALWDQIAGSGANPRIRVEIHREPWFIYDETFPVRYPYWEPSRVPSKAEYQASPQADCVGAGKTVRCSEWPARH